MAQVSAGDPGAAQARSPVVSEPRSPGSEGGGGRCTGWAGPCGLAASGVAEGAGMVMVMVVLVYKAPSWAWPVL